MKLNKNAFIEFLNAVRIKGSFEIKECVLRYTLNTLKVFAATENKIGAVRTELKVVSSEVETPIDIGIGDLPYLVKQISNFKSETLDMIYTKGNLVFSSEADKLKITIPTTNVSYINQVITKDEDFNTLVNKDNTFIVTSNICKEVSSLSNSLVCKDVLLKGNGKELTIKLTGDKNVSIEKSYTLDTEIKNKFSIKFSNLVSDLFSSLKSDISLSVKEGEHLYINKQNEYSKIEYILASYN